MSSKPGAGQTVRLSLDNLVTRHSAILGSTGSGKSTTVASILRSIVAPASESRSSPGARILLLDVRGEYSSALADIARVFSATPQPGEEQLFVPFWALELGELLEFVVGPLNENQNIAFTDKIYELKQSRLGLAPLAGLDATSLTVDSPVAFSLKRLWYELINFELTTFGGPNRDIPQMQDAGDPDTLTPPRYAPLRWGPQVPS